MAPQEPVIITASSSDTMQMMVEDHAGSQDKVNVTTVRGSQRFGYTRVTKPQLVVATIRTDGHAVVVGYGQQEGLFALILIDQCTQVNLVAYRIVEQNYFGVAENSRLLDSRYNGSGIGACCIGVIDTSFLLNKGTQFVLPLAFDSPRKALQNILNL